PHPHQRTRDGLLRVRQERLEGMAVELAGKLRAGEACPVCGSAEHPGPARPEPTTVTAVDEDAAADAEQRAAGPRARGPPDAPNREGALGPQ
ncbi:hypothetical protein K7G98_39665, partial [Saccharothrix sp. MB29]|nr:hypothetical protein [Saccharothrix sp. MB29]